MSYTVLGNGISPFVRKVLVVMDEKGLDYENQDVNPFSPPDGYRDISPLGRIPAFRHDDKIINDSSVICRYIDRLHPQPPLYSDDPYESARIEWLEEFVDGGLIPVVGPKIFLARVLRPLLTGEAADEAAVEKAIAEDLPPFFDYLDRQLGDAEFYVGKRLSLADITVAGGFVNLRTAGVKPDKQRWPRLAAFVKRMHARPTFAKQIEPVKAFLSKYWVELD